jgi:hypothetical protein
MRSSSRNKRAVVSALVIASCFLSTASWSQEFVAYEGKNAVREGDGGAKKVVGGVDFWSDGAPPRRYQLVGFITDRRNKSGLVGAISMSSLETDVASVAKKNGGDAVILMQSDAETIGAVGMANAAGGFGWGASRGVQKQNSKFAVVKYVADAPPAAVAPAGAVPLQQAVSAPQSAAPKLPDTGVQTAPPVEAAPAVQPTSAPAQ